MNEDISTASIGELIRSMALAVADAQAELDRSSFAVAERMSGQYALRDNNTGRLIDASGQPTTEPVLVDSRVQFGHTLDAEGKRQPVKLSMMELGFTPNFYQFVDTMIEVRLALRVERNATRIDPTTGKRISSPAAESSPLRITSQPLDATYTSTYSYKLEFASVFKTKIACVPPPTMLDERLRTLAYLPADEQASVEQGAPEAEPALEAGPAPEQQPEVEQPAEG